MLGRSAVLYTPFIKRTLSNKAMGSIWWALSKTSQRRLLVGTPSSLEPELAYRLGGAYSTLKNFILYFDILFNHLRFLCTDCYYLSPLVCCWSTVSIRMDIYKFPNVCPFDGTAIAGSGKVKMANRLTAPVSWLLWFQQTSRVSPPLLSNRIFLWRFCVVTLHI